MALCLRLRCRKAFQYLYTELESFFYLDVLWLQLNRFEVENKDIKRIEGLYILNVKPVVQQEATGCGIAATVISWDKKCVLTATDKNDMCVISRKKWNEMISNENKFIQLVD